MAKITSVEGATEVAKGYLTKHSYLLFRPLRVVREDGTWLVEADVGAFVVQVAKLRIDSETGVITEFESAR